MRLDSKELDWKWIDGACVAEVLGTLGRVSLSYRRNKFTGSYRCVASCEDRRITKSLPHSTSARDLRRECIRLAKRL